MTGRVGATMLLVVAASVSWAQMTVKLVEDQPVAPGGQAQFHFDLPEVPAGQQVRLGLDARIEWGGFGGNTGAMALEVNGQGLLGRHLINKPLVFAMRNDEELAWTAEDGNGYRLVYSADFTDRIKTDETYAYGLPDTDPYRFVWDVTSYVHPGANTVTLQATQGVSWGLRLRNAILEVGAPLPPLKPAAGAGPAAGETATGALQTYMPKPAVSIPSTIEVSSTGSLRFRVGRRQFTTRSRWSLPDGAWSEGGKAKPAWSQLRRGQTVTVRWQEPTYAVERKVTLEADRVAVADTVRNTSGDLVGVIVEHRLGLPDPPARCYLAGHLVKRLKQRESPSHPTAIAEYNDLAVGLVAEDDIFRIHCRALAEDGAVALADPQLGIAPGQSHTLEWSVTMTPGGDYWDFINTVRRKWGVNATLRGPSKWIHPSGAPTKPEQVKDWLQGDTMVVLCNPMFGTEEERAKGIYIEHGTALLSCQGWCDMAAGVTRAMKQANPADEAFIYTHQNLCTEPGHETKYQDSRARDVTGKAATTVYTPSPSLFVPTLNNSYGQALMGVYRLIAEKLDANVYIDEITASNVPAFGDYGTTWDGCTAVIDPVSHAVTARRSSAILLMQPWRAALMEYLKSRGKTAIANGPFYTRTMMGWGLQCFVESGPDDNTVIGAHLSHPLCLVQYGGPPTPARYTTFRRLLDRAGILFVAGTAEAPVFPLTPIELRPGVIIGEERILTNRSGRFGWGDGSTATVHVFDDQGQRVPQPDARELRQGKLVLTELRLPADHMAILVRNKR